MYLTFAKYAKMFLFINMNLFHCKNLIIKCSLNISSVFYLLIVYNYFLLKFYEIIEFMFINVHFEVK